MSWGERSCSHEEAPKNEYDGCSIATMSKCNVNCEYYTWDGKTEPDSHKIFTGKPAVSGGGYTYNMTYNASKMNRAQRRAEKK